jgi:hypothetical protein
MGAFGYWDKRDELKRLRLEREMVRHRYVNCTPPFDPSNSVLSGLGRSGDNVRLCLGWLIDEYENALASGRSKAWEDAVVATASLFASPVPRSIPRIPSKRGA